MNTKRYNTFWNRFLALIIDGLILQPLEWIDAHILSGSIESIGILGWGVFYSCIAVIYYVFMHAKYGQTIGKMIAKVKVLDVSEQRHLTIRQACMRDIVPIVMIPFSIYVYVQFAFYGQTWEGLENHPWFIYFGFIIIGWTLLEMVSMLFNHERRAIHDFIAGSVVVRTNLTKQSR